MELIPNVIANYAHKNNLLSASPWLLSNAAILSFSGIPFYNLKRNASSSTFAYIFLFLIAWMWYGFVDESSMRTLTRSTLL